MGMDDTAQTAIEIWGGGSGRALRVHWLAYEFGIPFTAHLIGPRTGETQTPQYTALNPKQKIPTLRHGDVVLSESAAIISYLSEAFPAPSGFFVPRTALERARVNEWCYFVMTEFDAHSLYAIRRHEHLAHIYGAEPGACASARDYFLKQANAIADRVATAGTYLMGEDFSVADILMTTCIDWAIGYGIAPPRALVAFRDRVAERPAYDAAMTLNHPDGLRPTSQTA